MKMYLLNETAVPVIAREGENGAGGIAVDCGAWAEEFPQGAGALVFRRADGEVYPLPAQWDPPRLTAVLSGTETEVPGLCSAEARWAVVRGGEETVIAKAGPYRFRVAPAVGGRVIAAPPPSWVDSVLAARDAAVSAKEAAEAAAAAAVSATVEETLGYLGLE